MSMNTDQGARNDDESAPSGLEALIAGLLSRVLRRLRYGRLVVRTPGGARLVFEGEAAGPQAEFELHDWRAARRLLLGGHIGFAESYMDGEWSSPDLTALIELVARNVELETSIGGSAVLRLIKRLRHGARANTRSGSRRNIEAHYDLGNEFYAHWLDETMT